MGKECAQAKNHTKPPQVQQGSSGRAVCAFCCVILQGEGICYRPCTGLSLFADCDVGIVVQLVS